MKLVKLDVDPVNKVYEGLAADEVEKMKHYTKPPRRFRASEAADCRRKIWFRLAGYTPDPDQPWLEMVSDAGGMYHDYTRQIMNHYDVGLTGFEVVDGKQVEDAAIRKTFKYDSMEFEVTARADASIELQVAPDVFRMASVEIKSMSFYDFDKVQRAFRKGGEQAVLDVIVEEHINYIWQGNVSAMLKDQDYVYLVLVGRANNSLGLSGSDYAAAHEWNPGKEVRRAGAVWEVEQEDKDRVLQKFADIYRDLEQGDMPAADFVDGSKPCNQCAMWRLCHGRKRTGGKYPVPGVE